MIVFEDKVQDPPDGIERARVGNRPLRLQDAASEESEKDLGGGATFNPKIVNGVLKLKKSRYWKAHHVLCKIN